MLFRSVMEICLSIRNMALYLAGTWRLYNVGSTSMQRHDVASTLRRRCIYVMCPLGKYYVEESVPNGSH